jgi:hypothetical protein
VKVIIDELIADPEPGSAPEPNCRRKRSSRSIHNAHSIVHLHDSTGAPRGSVFLSSDEILFIDNISEWHEFHICHFAGHAYVGGAAIEPRIHIELQVLWSKINRWDLSISRFEPDSAAGMDGEPL